MNRQSWWKSPTSVVIAGAVFAFGVTVTIFALNFRIHPISSDPASWGQFGDYLAGVLNPLFAFASAVLLAWTLRSQRLAAKRQAFENQFFSLLNLHGQLVAGIDVVHKQEDKSFITQTGRDCFKWYYETILAVAKKNSSSIAQAHGDWFIKDRGWEVEHYYRSIYHLFKYVHEVAPTAEISEDAIKRYHDLVKTQISRYELVLLYLNPETEKSGKWPDLIDDKLCKPFEHLDRRLLEK
jgi:Putative phage abortive infection protein